VHHAFARALSHVALATLGAVAAASTTAAQVPRIERALEIGCEDCGDARQFSSIWDVAVTDAGQVLVVDRDAPTLRMFDKTGRLSWSRGRPGAGPGEYRYAMRAALGAGGSVHVIDMRLRRLTRLGNDGAVTKSLTFQFFPAGVAARARQGELVILTDNFRRTGTLERWAPDADAPVRVMSFSTPEPGGGHIFSPSVAIAPNGDVAFLPTGERYEIQRISATGQTLPSLLRDIPRPRRTPEEIAAGRQRAQMVGGNAKASQERQHGGGSRSVLPKADPMELRPHAATDGLRYDDAGRLWVRTMRAIGSSTVFDVFGSNGQYVGEVTVPLGVQAFSLAGQYLATAAERDGVPIVVLWTVK
jgi:hypothetical protein